MGLIGLLLLATGFIMNIQVLRSPMRRSIPSDQFMRSTPFLVSAGLMAAGVVLVVLSGHH